MRLYRVVEFQYSGRFSHREQDVARQNRIHAFGNGELSVARNSHYVDVEAIAAVEFYKRNRLEVGGNLYLNHAVRSVYSEILEEVIRNELICKALCARLFGNYDLGRAYSFEQRDVRGVVDSHRYVLDSEFGKIYSRKNGSQKVVATIEWSIFFTPSSSRTCFFVESQAAQCSTY